MRLLALLACLPLAAHAEATITKTDVPPIVWSKPTPAEWALFGVTVGLIAVDVAQTRAFLRRGVPETNFFLGEHPSEARLYLTAGAGVLALGGIWYVLPSPWRSIALVPVIGIESFVVIGQF